MKKGIVLAVLLSLIAVTASSAQVRDDVYFDPDKDRVQVQRQQPVRGRDVYDDRSYSGYEDDYQSQGFDDDFDYYNDYDYYYTSRIRRFHRPYYGFGFFDPIYVDAWHYDPFLNPGVTVLIYDDFYSFRSWSRWNRWNAWGPGGAWGPRVNIGISFGWNNFGWNRWNAWDPWGWNSFGWNSWGWNSWNSWNRFNRFGWNSWGFGGPYWAGGGFVCPPTWGNGFAYNTVVNINNINNDNNYNYGPRSGGGVTGPAPGARPGRAPGFTDNSPGTAPRTINTAGDRLPESDRARIPAAAPGNTRGGDVMNPGERATPQPNRDADRFFDRYPSGNTENTRRDVPSTRIPTNDRVPSNTDRTAPSNRNIDNNSGTRTSPYPSYNPNRSNTYERPRSIDSGSRATPGATNPTRTSPSTTSDRPRVYTPPSRTNDSSYDRPRTSPSPSNSNNSGFSSPRSSGSSNSGFSSPRSSAPSGGSINNSSSRAGSSSSGSSSSSSSSGGRTRGN